jgi:phenylacetate-coenzyme A ligase PaaK-like adenylate-forming protein
MNNDPALQHAIKNAQEKLENHLREIIQWHFSPETGCPFWLDWATKAGWDPRKEIRSFADMSKFPHFQDEWLRDLQPEVWVPAKFKGKPFNIFETGGTTGMPKQRIGWEDYKVDYSEFSEKISDEHFPRNHKAYMEHVVDQAVTILKHRKVSALFTTPKLLEALGEKVNLWDAGIRGVFCGGTTMNPQYTRFLVEEVLENRIGFAPTYGNTLMGLAASRPIRPEDNYSITYHAPQPRAVLRVVNPNKTEETRNYGEWGRVELTTLTREFFMPRFLERDEAIRREPCTLYPWDGVAEVRPFGAMEKTIVEGVY